ncbi:MAG: hypothetical protein RI580_04425, partial [Halothece sp. Uz-M2-17]|nr:hypothetical protein [Halothece sp. Uz-M2-17]
GEGSDDYRIASGEIPTSLNTIIDFIPSVDQITFIGFADLDFTNVVLSSDGADTLIGLDSLDNDLFRLQGVSVNSLSETDFNFSAEVT